MSKSRSNTCRRIFIPYHAMKIFVIRHSASVFTLIPHPAKLIVFERSVGMGLETIRNTAKVGQTTWEVWIQYFGRPTPAFFRFHILLWQHAWKLSWKKNSSTCPVNIINQFHEQVERYQHWWNISNRFTVVSIQMEARRLFEIHLKSIRYKLKSFRSKKKKIKFVWRAELFR